MIPSAVSELFTGETEIPGCVFIYSLFPTVAQKVKDDNAKGKIQ